MSIVVLIAVNGDNESSLSQQSWRARIARHILDGQSITVTGRTHTTRLQHVHGVLSFLQ